MVLICAPWSRRAMQLSPLTLTLATFLIPYHWLQGSGFKKGVCAQYLMPWTSHPGAPLARPSFLEGLSLPSLVLSPLSSLKVHLPSSLPALGNCGWSGLGCHSDNNASPSVEHLSQLWQGVQWTLLSHLQYHQGPHCQCLPPHWHSFSSRCTIHAEGVYGWLTAFELPQREEAGCSQLTCAGCSQAAGSLHHLLLLCFTCHSKVVWVCLFISGCLEVGHHHLQLLR